MLQKGDLVPHFEVTTVQGDAVSYATVWQRRNLVLIALPHTESEPDRSYVSRLLARLPDLGQEQADCIITRDTVAGLPAPAALVADRWGEIAHVAGGAGVGDLPDPDVLLEWVQHVQQRCPECEGEAK